MKKALCVLLTLGMLLYAAPGLAYASPSSIDWEFLDSYWDYTPYWQRTTYGSGMEMTIFENATVNGHSYEFAVAGDGYQVRELALSGYYYELQMDYEANFLWGLRCYNNFWNVLENLIPDWYGATSIFSAYDIYHVLENGRPYVTSIDGWTVTTYDYYIVEATHWNGSILQLYVDQDDVFHFYVYVA